MQTTFDINKSPMIVVWEMTRGCDLSDSLCGTGAREKCDPLELSTPEAERLLKDIAELQPPIFAFTGDPLRREDVYQLVHFAARQGLRPVMAPGSSPHLDRKAIAELKHSGLWRLQLTLDGSTRELHDQTRRTGPSFRRTLEILQWANDWHLPVQINTNISTRNSHDLENLAVILKSFRVLLWNLTFPVAGDPEDADELPSAAEFEAIFARLYELAQQVPFKIKTTEAQHYRRYVLQQRARAKSDKVWQAEFGEGIPGVMPVNQGRATVFISHAGEVYPGACMPVSAGNVRFQKLGDIYRTAEIFTALRDVSKLTGKCGQCNFKEICGGSRARALSMLGDMFTEDVSCIYRPGANPRVRNRPQLPQQIEGAKVEEPR